MFDRLRALLRKAQGEVPLAWLLVAAAAGSITGMPLGEKVFEYQWRDARFCDDCHTHDYANQGWARSVHYGLTTCHDCHRVPISHYPKNLWITLTRKPDSQADIPMPDIQVVVCEQCHSEAGAHEELTGPMKDALREQVVKIDRSPLHQKHLDSKTREPAEYHGGNGDDSGGGEAGAGGSITCMDCHGAESNRAHRFEPQTDNCLNCHENQRPKGVRAAELGCRHCHYDGFAAGAPSRSAGDAESGD
jgi:hypothetical protein